MNNKYIKVIIGALVFCITIVGLYVFADITSMKTLSRVEVTETPRWEVELAGAFDSGNFTVGDNNKSNEIFPTKDGGWIASNHTNTGKSNLVKYKRDGTVEWTTQVDSAIDKNHYKMVYPNEPDRTYDKITDKNPQYGDIRHVTEALDGSGYFVQTNNYNILTKYDTNGNKLWQSQHYDEMYRYTYERVCTYEGNTDADGKVRTYYWTNRFVGRVEEWYWEENSNFVNLDDMWIGGDNYRIDAEHYYCGVKTDYLNYRSAYSGYVVPDTEGGAYLIINANYPKFLLDDGREIEFESIPYTAHHYDKDGKYIGVYNLSDLFKQGIDEYTQQYNVNNIFVETNPYAAPRPYYISASDLYHAYVGAYDNGDILMAPYGAKHIIKFRLNKEQDKMDLLMYTSPGFRGRSFADYYSNFDGILDFKLNNTNGGFTLIMNTATNYSPTNSTEAYYNTEKQEYNLTHTYVDYQGNVSLFPGSSTPIQVYNAEGKYDNLFFPGYGSETKSDEVYNSPYFKNDYFYYSTGSGNGTGFLMTGDGGAIVFLPFNNYQNTDWNFGERGKTVEDVNGNTITISDEASFLIYKVNSNSQIEWMKQYKGLSKFGQGNTKVRISNDGKTVLLPVTVAAGAKELGTDLDVETLAGGTGKKFLLFNMLFDREEREIPDPTTTTSTTKPTTTKTTKTTKPKKTKTTTTTEPITEETTETTTTTSTSTTSRTTTTKQKEEVKGEEKKKPDVKKIVTIVGISFVGLFTGGFTFYFIPFVIIPRRKRVLVAMSGGPASAVAAKKLLDKHYKVYGLFISNSSNLQAFSNAKQIANKLEIDLFEQEINDVYKNKLAQGLAEHPGEDLDKLYNKYILLEALKDVAKEQHIKYIATGHYATKKSGSIQSGVNQVFDESDKLSLLTSDDIKKLLLPIGELDYQEVTKIAEANNINLTNTKQTPEEKIGANNIPKKD